MVVKVVAKDKRSHLVAVVKGTFESIFILDQKIYFSALVPEAEGLEDRQSPWYVFNDFVVHNISEEEALSFPGKWKVRGSHLPL